MARRKPPEDEVQAAFRVVAQATGEKPKKAPRKQKNPHAVALGRKGGLAAGKTRMDKIPKERRIEIARQAAEKRWEKQK
jgi:hypothetical protein